MSGILHQKVACPVPWFPRPQPAQPPTALLPPQRAPLWFSYEEEEAPLLPLWQQRLRYLAELRLVVVVSAPVPVFARRIHQVAAARWLSSSGAVARSS
jgi:hypothetical protein